METGEISDRLLIDAINEELHREYRVLDGRPIYHIVWSEDQLEVRFSKTWTDWYGSILIRQEHNAVREVKKYWYFKQPCWVLEKLIFITGYQDLKDIQVELIHARNGVYESVYAFHTKDDIPLPVNRRVLNFILYSLHNPVKHDWDEVERLEEQEEYDYFLDQISQDERSPLFVWENSAFVSTTQMKFKEQYKEPLDKLVTLT